MNEAEPIRLAQQGDENAWISLIRHHQTAVFRFAYLLVGDVDDAEDVTQDVFIHAFRALDRFDPERPLRPWLLQITKNLAANQRRSMRRYVALLRRWWQEPPQGTDSTAPNLSAENNAQQAAGLLWQAVRRLNQADQEVIYLRYFLELSVAETAAALNIAEGTVKSRLSRALERLRAIVKHEFPELGEEVVA